MKSKYIIIGLAAAAVSVGITACVSSGGEKDRTVSLNQVPQAAKDTLRQYASESDVKGVDMEDQDGTQVYGFDISQGGHSFELAVTPNGKFMGTEEDIQVTDMPEAAQMALKAQAGGGNLSGFEKAVDQNHRTTYEADIEKNGKKTEVAVDADGNVVGTESTGTEKGD
ncbi:MAG: hypothetical protein KGR98_02835 [Verrucomicrobia bacterium]|nr:hypothetical protein [Verrucomicrobiota bacterium]MDE3098413.1 hypothetical protein [Verrucomicrobiota bacterium]